MLEHPQGKFQLSDEDSSNPSETEDDLTKSTQSRPSTPKPSTSIPISEQLNRNVSLQEIKQTVKNTFEAKNHPEIIETFTDEYYHSAFDVAKNLFNGELDGELKDFEKKLLAISGKEVKALLDLLMEEQALEFLSKQIYDKALSQLSYSDVIKHSATIIFKDNSQYKAHIFKSVKDLLFDLCNKNLQTSKKEHLGTR